MTVRRIGWIGVSLGLTSVLSACGVTPSDASTSADETTTAGYLDTENGLTALNGLTAMNGLNSQNGLSAQNGLTSANGLSAWNGLTSSNGLTSMNGMSAANGLTMMNGLNSQNGLSAQNGLTSSNGLMTTDGGRMTVSYMVKCALAEGDTLVKADQNGTNYTYKGSLGLAPGYKDGACDIDCMEALSACLMAHVNTTGVHIPLWMTSPMASIGWGQSPYYPTQEGTFFGNVMLTNAVNNLDAYFCNGNSVAKDTVPGRLGQQQGAPYANAYPTSGGLCSSAGHCVMQGSGDGAISCDANGETWTRPMTVWRGQIFQAENATLSGDKNYMTETDSSNSNGKRVKNIGPYATVKFTGVKAAGAGSNGLVVYYANGDCPTGNLRYFNVKVNGGTAQSRSFGSLECGNWHKIGQAIITLSGFNAGTNNTVEFMGDGNHSVPDLDWIEIIPPPPAPPVPTGTCDRSKWIETAQDNSSTAGLANDGNLTTRWSTGAIMTAGDWYQIDFTGTVKLSSITLNNSQTSGGDYPGSVEVYASADGSTFDSSPFVTANGSATQTNINFAQRSLKAVKVKIKTARSGSYWSIGEFQAGCAN